MTKRTKLRIAKDALIDVYRSVTLPRLYEQGFFIPNAMGAFEGREQGVDYYPIARIGDGYIEVLNLEIWLSPKKPTDGPRGPRGVVHARVNVTYSVGHLAPGYVAPEESDFQPRDFHDASLILDESPPILSQHLQGWFWPRLGSGLLWKNPDRWSVLDPSFGLKKAGYPTPFNVFRVPYVHFWERETEEEARAQAVEEMGNYLSLIETWPKRRINVLSICGVNSYKVENRKTIKTGVLLPHEEEFQRVFVRPYL